LVYGQRTQDTSGSGKIFRRHGQLHCLPCHEALAGWRCDVPNMRQHADGEVITDAERFDMAITQIVGKRLTCKALIGKEVDRPEKAF
jgi:hypothetical protein